MRGEKQGSARSPAPPQQRTVDRMASLTRAIRLELELDEYGDHVAGRIGDRRGRLLPFTGWLELMAAVETLCGRSDEPVGWRLPSLPEPDEAVE